MTTLILHACVTDGCRHNFCVYIFCRLGEACSHIAALLSCLVAAVESRENAGTDSVTSQSCKWLPPANNVYA